MRRSKTLAAAVLVALLAAACGDDATTDEVGSDDPEAGAPTDPDPGSHGSNQDGGQDQGEERSASPSLATVEVGGVAYRIDSLTACEPYEQGHIQRDLELQGRGSANGETVQIDVYVQTIAGAPHDAVAWAGPEGIFGDGDVEVDWTGERVTGSADLVDARGGDEVIEVVFDLPVPDERFACR